MKNQLVLIENLHPGTANLIVEENSKTRDSYLTGIFMQANVVNGNGRNYPLSEIANAVKGINQRISEGLTVYGELNHPANLQIDLNNVSHIITSMVVEGNDAIGKAKILDTPKGQIVKAILSAGGKLGVSSRGSGNVNEGTVSDFNLITVDIVATPSAPNAYPKHVMEALENSGHVMNLAEAYCNDPSAQKYFKAEVLKFFEMLTGQQVKK